MNVIVTILKGITVRLSGAGAGAAQTITRYSDIALVLVIVAILVMIIIPIPPWMIDILISINLTAAIALLCAAVYISSAVELSIFPSLLLITTLYRLGLNIATTRQILLNADAGEIIFSFANFVVAGNFVVGGVIFLIITLVQFIVIVKVIPLQ